MLTTLLISQVLLSLFLTGLIWTVQLVHYPTFRWIHKNHFPAYPSFHAKQIFPLTAIPMLAELLGAIGLVYYFALNSENLRASQLAIPSAEFLYINLASVIILWLLTMIVSMPLHSKIQKAYSLEACKKLTLTNWPRTMIWSMRSIAWLYWLGQLIEGRN